MTGSPVLFRHTIITGVSASGASGPGATYRGAIVALDDRTGQILWRTYSLPDNGGVAGGYAGATMFSSPVVDARLGLVYGTFGNPYTEPADVAACNAAAPNGFDEACEQPGAYFKSIVAFDLHTGAVRWSYRVLGHAPWERACGSPPLGVTWCPAESDAEQWDLGGASPNVIRLGRGFDARDAVGVGEKGGIYVLLDARTGAFIWNTVVGAGGDQGGFEWGTAYDGTRIYASITNQHHLPYNLTERGVVTDQTVTGGAWSALDPASGEILWQTADPQTETLPDLGTVGVWDLAPVTSANGVVYTASMAQTGNEMYALDARDRRDPLGVPGGQLGQRRAGRLPRERVLGQRLLEGGRRVGQQPAVRVQHRRASAALIAPSRTVSSSCQARRLRQWRGAPVERLGDPQRRAAVVVGRHEVHAELAPHGLRVLPHQGVHDRGVDPLEVLVQLVLIELGPPVRHDQHRQDHRRQREPGLQERAAAAVRHQRPMERDVELGEPLVRDAAGGLDLGVREADLLGARATLDAAGGRDQLELEAHQEQVEELLLTEPAHHRASAAGGLDEPLGMELLEGVADGPAAHAELLRERRLDQRGPRDEASGDDVLAQRVDHPARVDAARELPVDGRVVPARQIAFHSSPRSC